MTASFQSIVQGLSSVLGVAVLVLLPMACETSGARAGGAAPREAVGLRADLALSKLAEAGAVMERGSPEREAPMTCLGADAEGPETSPKGEAKVEAESQPSSQPGDASGSPVKCALDEPSYGARRDPKPAAPPGS